MQNPVTGKLEFAHYRVSKSAWLRDEESEVVAKVNQRISDITGLSMSSAEELQVQTLLSGCSAGLRLPKYSVYAVQSD